MEMADKNRFSDEKRKKALGSADDLDLLTVFGSPSGEPAEQEPEEEFPAESEQPVEELDIDGAISILEEVSQTSPDVAEKIRQVIAMLNGQENAAAPALGNDLGPSGSSAAAPESF